MTKKQKLNRHLITAIIILLLSVLFIFLTIDRYQQYKRQADLHSASVIDTIDQRVNSLVLEIKEFPKRTSQDILFLSRLPIVSSIANSSGASQKEVRDLGQVFLEFLIENLAYYQLRYLDENGQEIVRAEFNSDQDRHFVVPKDELQNKAGRDYFIKTMSMEKGEVYISLIDLNLENGGLENRGTKENPRYVPVIRYATPIFDNQGNRKGVVVANIYADYFLEDIRRFQREGEVVFLTNKDGYYLAHPDRSKEFGFVLGAETNNIINDYPSLVEQINAIQGNKRIIETDDEIIDFRQIDPITSSFEIYKGAERVFGKNPEKSLEWTLVSISEKDELEKTLGDFRKNLLFSIGFSGTVTFISGVLVFVLVFISLNGDKKKNKK